MSPLSKRIVSIAEVRFDEETRWCVVWNPTAAHLMGLNMPEQFEIVNKLFEDVQGYFLSDPDSEEEESSTDESESEDEEAE